MRRQRPGITGMAFFGGGVHGGVAVATLVGGVKESKVLANEKALVAADDVAAAVPDGVVVAIVRHVWLHVKFHGVLDTELLKKVQRLFECGGAISRATSAAAAAAAATTAATGQIGVVVVVVCLATAAAAAVLCVRRRRRRRRRLHDRTMVLVEELSPRRGVEALSDRLAQPDPEALLAHEPARQ